MRKPETRTEMDQHYQPQGGCPTPGLLQIRNYQKIKGPKQGAGKQSEQRY
jgi:hypothetical protein